MVKQEAAINPDVVVEVVRNALRRVVDSETVRIRVNLADLDTIRSARTDLMTVIDGLRNVEIVEDRRVSAGDASWKRPPARSTPRWRRSSA